jgi:hypothetical protein
VTGSVQLIFEMAAEVSLENDVEPTFSRVLIQRLFFSLCTEIHRKSAIVAHFIAYLDFRNGGDGHLGKWRRTAAFALVELGMCPFFCVQNFIKIG